MTLRIMRSSQTGAGRSVPVDSAKMLASAGLVSAVQNKIPVFEELKSGLPRLGENRAIVCDSLIGLNKMLSVVHRLTAALSAVHGSMRPDELAAVGAVIQGITKSVPGRKVTELFDPRRSEERFRALMEKLPQNNTNTDSFLRAVPGVLKLLESAEVRILDEIAAKERYLGLAAVEEENIKAHESVFAGQEMLSLYKAFMA